MSPVNQTCFPLYQIDYTPLVRIGKHFQANPLI